MLDGGGEKERLAVNDVLQKALSRIAVPGNVEVVIQLLLVAPGGGFPFSISSSSLRDALSLAYYKAQIVL